MTRWLKRALYIVLGLLAVALVYQWRAGAPVTAPAEQVDATGGSYEALTPPQRRLIDDWATRVGQAAGKQIDPDHAFDAMALSTRTTFDAITHALSHTPLTSADGTAIKVNEVNLTALDLIEKVDAVAGSVPDAGGDKQFRMYVQLRPDTQKILEQSREFSRQVDNTVYHKGFPICFRGTGGTPSIQFSLAPDGTRGDIDVDYRASEFPIMLINGHLTASNSDVRAGNNDERHNGHWKGLENWWREFLGLVVGDLPGADAAAARSAATEPRLGKGTKPADAIADFMKAWLVEQNPAAAVGYIAPRAFACLETARGVAIDRGVARVQIAATMQAVNHKIGKITSLAQASEAVPLTGSRGREIPQSNRDAFVMYDLRDDLAASFDCENRLHPEQADAKLARSTEFGHFVGAVFRLKAGNVRGDSVATLWSDESGSWRLIAYVTEPELTPGALPSAPLEPTDSAPLRVVDGDPAMLRAADKFFNAWLVQKDVPAAFAQMSHASYACYNKFRPDDAPAVAMEDAGKRVMESMSRAAELVGAADRAGSNGSRLEDLITGIELHHPDLELVKHSSSDAFTVVSVPLRLASAAMCDGLYAGLTPPFYAAATRLTRAGADGAVLWTLWAKDGGKWKVVSYLVIAP